LINQGRYDEAIPLLQRAVDGLDGSGDITYGYALFNLGHALRLAGRPEEAIPVLEQRLQIPNQRGEVQRELDAAYAAAGYDTGGGEGGGEGPGNGNGQAKGHEKDD
jgi:serine/threonine-protein kinase